jgi:hypothetical protein
MDPASHWSRREYTRSSGVAFIQKQKEGTPEGVPLLAYRVLVLGGLLRTTSENHYVYNVYSIFQIYIPHVPATGFVHYASNIGSARAELRVLLEATHKDAIINVSRYVKFERLGARSSGGRAMPF